MTITHRQRIETCLSGQKPDQVPVAMWRHWPVEDQTADGMAGATARFQKLFDFDFIKVTPSSSFCLKDWGSDDVWSGEAEGTREYIKFPIHQPEDWAKLKVLDPTKGSLGIQLEALRLLVKEFSPNTPVIQTIFNPMAQAKNLVANDRFLVHMRQNPEAVQKGLETITQSILRFVEAAQKIGIDGVFYAVQHAQYGILNESEFEAFSRSYDLRILETCQSSWLNLLHLHGEDVMFKKLADYPAGIINWHDRHTWPSLSEGKKVFKGIVCGGLKRIETMVLGDPESVKKEALSAIEATEGIRFILGTGCVLPINAPHCNIMAARRSVLKG